MKKQETIAAFLFFFHIKAFLRLYLIGQLQSDKDQWIGNNTEKGQHYKYINNKHILQAQAFCFSIRLNFPVFRYSWLSGVPPLPTHTFFCSLSFSLSSLPHTARRRKEQCTCHNRLIEQVEECVACVEGHGPPSPLHYLCVLCLEGDRCRPITHFLLCSAFGTINNRKAIWECLKQAGGRVKTRSQGDMETAITGAAPVELRRSASFKSIRCSKMCFGQRCDVGQSMYFLSFL